MCILNLFILKFKILFLQMDHIITIILGFEPKLYHWKIIVKTDLKSNLVFSLQIEIFLKFA